MKRGLAHVVLVHAVFFLLLNLDPHTCKGNFLGNFLELYGRQRNYTSITTGEDYENSPSQTEMQSHGPSRDLYGREMYGPSVKDSRIVLTVFGIVLIASICLSKALELCNRQANPFEIISCCDVAHRFMILIFLIYENNEVKDLFRTAAMTFLAKWLILFQLSLCTSRFLSLLGQRLFGQATEPFVSFVLSFLLYATGLHRFLLLLTALNGVCATLVIFISRLPFSDIPSEVSLPSVKLLVEILLSCALPRHTDMKDVDLIMWMEGILCIRIIIGVVKCGLAPPAPAQPPPVRRPPNGLWIGTQAAIQIMQ